MSNCNQKPIVGALPINAALLLEHERGGHLQAVVLDIIHAVRNSEDKERVVVMLPQALQYSMKVVIK